MLLLLTFAISLKYSLAEYAEPFWEKKIPKYNKLYNVLIYYLFTED